MSVIRTFAARISSLTFFRYCLTPLCRLLVRPRKWAHCRLRSSHWFLRSYVHAWHKVWLDLRMRFVFQERPTDSPNIVVNTPIAITNSAPAPTNTCGGCYVVADVAGIQFGQDTITQLQQGTVSVGFNQTKTITSLVGTTEFTIAPTGVIGTGALFNFGTTILYSGVILCVLCHDNTNVMQFLADILIGLHPPHTTFSRPTPLLRLSSPMVDALSLQVHQRSFRRPLATQGLLAQTKQLNKRSSITLVVCRRVSLEA